jgi:hypothetical protein
MPTPGTLAHVGRPLSGSRPLPSPGPRSGGGLRSA